MAATIRFIDCIFQRTPFVLPRALSLSLPQWVNYRLEALSPSRWIDISITLQASAGQHRKRPAARMSDVCNSIIGRFGKYLSERGCACDSVFGTQSFCMRGKQKKRKGCNEVCVSVEATLMGRNAPGTATTRQGINSFLRIINKSMLCVCVPATTGTDFERCTADLSCVPKSGCNKEETTEKKSVFCQMYCPRAIQT